MLGFRVRVMEVERVQGDSYGVRVNMTLQNLTMSVVMLIFHIRSILPAAGGLSQAVRG